MKFFYLIFGTLFLITNAWAQAPQKMSYQAVIRNGNNQLVANHDVAMRISILQGSLTGSVVYSEIQKTTTNANGLVSIEFGGELGFDTINWANGPYFIKTETDPSGYSNFLFTGTTRLLSVPYALHAITADRIAGAVEKPEAHYVGEIYGGGVVFWVDHTGTHGLICSMIDIGFPKEWSEESGTPNNGMVKSDWNGQSNTNAIVTRSTAASAARQCDSYINTNYGTGVYNDWYLPSRDELNCLWNNIYSVKKALENDGNDTTTAIQKGDYWTSTEYNDKYVWIYSFIYGYVFNNLKTKVCYVRAVRAF